MTTECVDAQRIFTLGVITHEMVKLGRQTMHAGVTFHKTSP